DFAAGSKFSRSRKACPQRLIELRAWRLNCNPGTMPNKSAVLVAETSKENAADTPLMQLLQKQVANGFVLYANYKHYHWQVTGPLFRDLHKLFDDLAQDVLPTIDDFAERIRMIGQDPIFSPQHVTELASVSVSEEKGMREMIQEADNNLLV